MLYFLLSLFNKKGKIKFSPYKSDYVLIIVYGVIFLFFERR